MRGGSGCWPSEPCCWRWPRCPSAVEAAPGVWAVPVALGIALCKAVLIAFFFMHLVERPGGPRLVIGTAGVFVGILVGLVLAEAAARAWPTLPPGPFPVSRLPGTERSGPPRVAPPWLPLP